VTDCVVCEFDRAMAMKLRRSETVLPDALRWSDAREAAIVQQHLISIGRRSAIARVAHLLLELGARLKLVGLAEDDGYRCPLSQELLGDALGLTKIHVNRMLRELRELGCLTFRNGRVTFGDMARLIDLADYDPAYLDAAPSRPRTGHAGLAGAPHPLVARERGTTLPSTASDYRGPIVSPAKRRRMLGQAEQTRAGRSPARRQGRAARCGGGEAGDGPVFADPPGIGDIDRVLRQMAFLRAGADE
jgi:biotin operon repressor